MKSRLFHSNDYKAVQEKVRELVNRSPDFLSTDTAQSPRAAGDAIEKVMAASFDKLLGDHCGEYSSDFARRAMADLAFKDSEGLYYIVDVKTHRTDTKFNMPNLTSVERLARFYEDDSNFFTVLLISYGVEGVKTKVTDVTFVPIEFLGWDCLTIGALGWGQIQIANSNIVTVNPGYSRKRWMLEFCDVMLEFYPKEIAKIGERVSRFEEVRAFWSKKADE
uniref:Restriction endonuclease n=1 Tax=Candidatus Kentrum sp. SD TaxID=2126332 RepID=A0A451BJN6_9GAMM|nr:MAG: hypothetical protein BECKSD772F_GA0070984_106911 [Candidatus Kentron sp. SD]VFK46186.1 MAG: hypothetical protein BECKSD772E_GA0070983_106811 [Candidatus Kentron sp. SD]VFK78438.1 MAG: hypothetical protein BECKSD772D_GA0070982_101512 [Candidatus Kentron sp. SD]